MSHSMPALQKVQIGFFYTGMHDTLWSSSLEKLTWILSLVQTEIVENDIADSFAGSAILDNFRPLSIFHTTSILSEKTMCADDGLRGFLRDASCRRHNQ